MIMRWLWCCAVKLCSAALTTDVNAELSTNHTDVHEYQLAIGKMSSKTEVLGRRCFYMGDVFRSVQWRRQAMRTWARAPPLEFACTEIS